MKKSNPPAASESNWMEEALKLAERAASEDEVPVGAVLVHEGRVIGRGANRREQDQSPTSHAEILAIEAAARALGSWRLLECELYVTLEPCPMCLAACQQARVSRVIYGAADPKGGALSLGYPLHEDKRINHRFEVVYRENAECSRVLKEFFAKKRGK
ncbi:MAG: nucleoside deaminase [Bdellovibrionota bacterium]